jgi:hypothetical protein
MTWCLEHTHQQGNDVPDFPDWCPSKGSSKY